MIMTKKYKILAQFIKDISGETGDVETYFFVKENIKKYILNIDIASKPLKNKLIEINTSLKFEDKELHDKKSHFELIYTTVISIDDDLKDQDELKKIILCDIQNIIYPNIEKALLNLIRDSGYPEIKFEKKVDFEKLYNERFN